MILRNDLVVVMCFMTNELKNVAGNIKMLPPLSAQKIVSVVTTDASQKDKNVAQLILKGICFVLKTMIVVTGFVVQVSPG